MKCDEKDCGQESFITLKSKVGFQINVCPIHYLEQRNNQDWEIQT